MAVMSVIADKPKLPDNYREKTWDQLKDAIDAIHNSRAITSSLEELYQVILCLFSSQFFTGFHIVRLFKICAYTIWDRSCTIS